ncbi:MAG: YqgE/AlgH family protein [Solirubrobacterales bacterium]
MDDALSGKLLIAAPSLHDFFRRTVVLTVEHNEQGAFGVVLNRPSETSVAEVVPSLAPYADVEEVVRIGGPVATDTAVALGRFDDPDSAAGLVVGDLGVIDPDDPGDEVRELRVYAGHAGWGPGQLESEVEQDAWIIEPASADDPFRDGDLWSYLLGRRGGEYALLARMPEDPSMN